MTGPELTQILTGFDNRLADLTEQVARLADGNEVRQGKLRALVNTHREDWHRLSTYWRELAARVTALEAGE